MPKNLLIPTAEAAEILGVHPRTVHRMVEAGRLTPSLKIAGKTGPYLFDRDAIDRAAAAREAA